eukprot:1145857-Prymnesium_polylepis.1
MCIRDRIATDDEAHAALRDELPSQVVRCPDAIAGAHGRAQPLRYRSAGWTRLMFAVPKMVRWVLRMELDVLWMDTDVVALSDPFPVRAPPPAVCARARSRAARRSALRAQGKERARRVRRAALQVLHRLIGGQPREALSLLASVDGRFPDEDRA